MPELWSTLPEDALAEDVGSDPVAAAERLISSGEPRKAGALLAKIPAGHSRYLEATLMLSEILIGQGHADAAIRRLTDALPSNAMPRGPHAMGALYRLAILYEENGQREPARETLARLNDLDSNYMDVQQRLNRLGQPNSQRPSGPSTPGAPMVVQGRPIQGRAPSIAPRSPSVVPRTPSMPAARAPSMAPVRSNSSVPADDSSPLVLDLGPDSQLAKIPQLPANPPHEPDEVLDPGPSLADPEATDRIEAVSISKRPDPPDEVLRRCVLFAALDDTQLKEIALLVEQVRFEAGQRVLERGEDPPGVFVLREGTVEVGRRTLSHDAYLGEAALLGETSDQEATAASEVDALLLRRDQLSDYLSAREASAAAILRALAKDLTQRLRSAD